MHCRYCQEAILSDWRFCRWCGAALTFTKAAPIIANKELLDASLSLFVAGGQAQQAALQRQAQGASDPDLLEAKLMAMACSLLDRTRRCTFTCDCLRPRARSRMVGIQSQPWHPPNPMAK